MKSRNHNLFIRLSPKLNMKKKDGLRKIWDFIWNSDSAASWIIDLILAFILVRFVIFPLLGFFLATSLPLVVIESGSMEHNTLDFDDWWQTNGEWYLERNITQTEFQEWHFSDGLDKGDVIITKGKDKYEPGDIIIFTTEIQTTPIIHRIIKYDKNWQAFETKGDNNPEQLVYEKRIKKDAVISTAAVRIPKIGWIKLIFIEALRSLAK